LGCLVALSLGGDTIPKVDVVIVGGGIIGCAVGFHLAKAGVKPLILEKTAVAAEASSGAAGLLTAQTHSDDDGPLFTLKLASRALYPALADELRERTDLDIEYRRLGHVFPALTDAEVAEVKGRIAWQTARGLSARWVSAEDARRIEPGITEQLLGAGFFQDDQHVNNTAVTQALATACQRLGATIRVGCEVTDLVREGERVSGVRAGQERIEAGLVVLAAGAWSGGFAAAIGLPLPVVPAKGQIIVARTPAPTLAHVAYGAEAYVIPRQSGEHIIGSTVEYVGFDKRVTVEGIAGLLVRATALVPALRDAEMVASWGCLRPASSDGLPILGAVPNRPGLILATGHFRNGILLGPITGQLIGELILTGRPSIPLEPFRPDRTFPEGFPADN
jgi:glycine oxidase